MQGSWNIYFRRSTPDAKTLASLTGITEENLWLFSSVSNLALSSAIALVICLGCLLEPCRYLASAILGLIARFGNLRPSVVLDISLSCPFLDQSSVGYKNVLYLDSRCVLGF